TGATWDCPDDTKTGNHKPNCTGGTWNLFGPKQPFAATASASTTITNAAAGTISLDVTADIKGMMSGTLTDDGWILARDARSVSGAVDFYSREAGRWAPTLVVVYN
ncbi:MAG TPA: DNRLRE domain-containing protein, partial [Candidatus Paceibacterota bacterium]|nr:DNRLRE domain-containing protein [Candidatus Paceibacterota bacterium]